MSSLLELLKSKQKQIAASNRKKTAKPPAGTSRWRVLPSWRGAEDQFWHDFGQHFIKDSTGTLQSVYMCVDRTYGKPCGICDAVRAGIKNAGDDASLKVIKEAGAAARVLVNACHLDSPNPSEVHILELSPTQVFNVLVGIIADYQEAGENPLDPVSGRDIVINREGTGLSTKYTVNVGAKSTKLSPDVMTKLNDLDAYVAQESAEAEQRALNSVRTVAGLLPAPASAARAPTRTAIAASTIVEEEEEYAAPPKRAAKPAAKAAPVVEEFEDVPSRDVDDAPGVESTGDSELDDLLAKLG